MEGSPPAAQGTCKPGSFRSAPQAAQRPLLELRELRRGDRRGAVRGTWSPDLDSGGVEVDACDHSAPGPGHPSLQVWCAGYDSTFAGKVYTLKLAASSG